MRNDLLIIIQSYSKYDTYGKEKNYKCIAKPIEVNKILTSFTFVKKKLCVHSNFFIYFFF